MIRKQNIDQHGFTIVELVIGMMLSVMLLAAIAPILLSGIRTVKARQRRLEAELLGDSIFQCAAKELQGMEPQTSGAVSVAETFLEAFTTECLDEDYHLEEYGFDAELYVEALEHEWIRLQVTLLEREQICYVREETMFLPNQERSKSRER